MTLTNEDIHNMRFRNNLFLPNTDYGWLHRAHVMAVEGADMGWLDAWDDARILGRQLIFRGDEAVECTRDQYTAPLPDLSDRRWDPMVSGFYPDDELGGDEL